MAKDENVQQEGSFETGSDEFWKSSSQLNYNNIKAFFDKMMMHDTETRAQAQTGMAALFTDAMQKNDASHNMLMAMQKSMIENMDAMSKQMIRHADIAIDRTWNVDEQGYQAAKILKNMGVDESVIAKVLAEMTQKKSASK